MPLAQLRYKKYAGSDILPLFAPETVLFSRRGSYGDGATGRVDRLAIAADKTADNDLIWTIKATMLNPVDAVIPLLLAVGFSEQPAGGGRTLVREWRGGSPGAADVSQFLAAVVKAAEEVVASLPLLLYCSREYKIARDYLSIMAAGAPLAPVRKLSLECRDNVGFSCGQAPLFWVTCLAQNRWAAWMPGDDFAPVFASPHEAAAFSRQRRRLFAPAAGAAIGVYESSARDMYQLTDSKKSLRERIRWLRHETARLEQLAPIGDQLLEQAK